MLTFIRGLHELICMSMMRSIWILALLCSLLDAETLRDVLREKNLAPGLAMANLDKPITSYQVLDDSQTFLIAYYVDNGSGRLRPPLMVSLFDKAQHKWRSTDITPEKLADDTCLGSAIGAETSGGMFYLETHINPSAGCMIVLSPDLSVRKVLSGWFLAGFGDGRIIYHRNEIHFAAAHAAELAIYDARTGGDFQIYPHKPFQAVRQEHIRKFQAFLARNQDWCNAHNHSCDPEWFNNEITGKVTVSATNDSLAFTARLDNTDFWDEADRIRLEAFRETRGYLKKRLPIAAPPEGELLRYLQSDLERIGRLEMRGKVLDLFPAADPLRKLLDDGFNGQAIAAGWANAEIRQRLEKAIAVPAEFTDVVYVYRNLRDERSVEYREILQADWDERLKGIPVNRAVESEILKQVFER